MTTPIAATARTWVRKMPSTMALVAPMLFMVAMTLRRLSMNVATALAMPTPPTSSAVKPMNVRNWRRRSSVRLTCGDGSRRSATVKPASGNSVPMRSRRLPSSASVASLSLVLMA